MLIAEKVLTSQKHLETCVGKVLSEVAESLPRILTEITET